MAQYWMPSESSVTTSTCGGHRYYAFRLLWYPGSCALYFYEFQIKRQLGYEIPLFSFHPAQLYSCSDFTFGSSLLWSWKSGSLLLISLYLSIFSFFLVLNMVVLYQVCTENIQGRLLDLLCMWTTIFLNCGIENWAHCIYYFYLSIFLSFVVNLFRRIFRNYMFNTSYLVYR